MRSEREISRIFGQFAADGDFGSATVFPGGLINRSWLVETVAGTGSRRFLLQEMNTTVFPRPDLVMRNIALVTEHLGRRAPDEPTLEFLPLSHPGPDGSFLARQEDGSCWRLCRYIENTRTAARLTGPDEAEAVGRAYGRFLALLSDLPADRLAETIPGFHDTPARWAACLQADHEDPLARAKEAGPEMEALWSRAELAKGLSVVELPRRVVHNDAKLANVLLDAGSGQGVCVVDLDTVMPGSALHDFGDMMRTMCCPVDEEETDPERIRIDTGLFAALARGYLAETGEVLSEREKENLVLSGLVITFEQAVRFLTDYLWGDVYFHTTRPDQNLDRCRNQLRLLESMQVRYGDMMEIITDLLSG